MKNLKISIVLVGLLFVLNSCNKKTDVKEMKTEITLATNDESDNNQIENLQKISLEIEGMTCEIGCARTIQSKLSKKDGVKSAKVSFEDKEGVIEFDANKITKSQVIEAVNQIAGGDVYNVVKTEVIK